MSTGSGSQANDPRADLGSMTQDELREWMLTQQRQSTEEHRDSPKPGPNPVKARINATWPSGPRPFVMHPGARGEITANSMPVRDVLIAGLREVEDNGPLALLVRDHGGWWALRRRPGTRTWGEDAHATSVQIENANPLVLVTGWRVPHDARPLPAPPEETFDMLAQTLGLQGQQ